MTENISNLHASRRPISRASSTHVLIVNSRFYLKLLSSPHTRFKTIGKLDVNHLRKELVPCDKTENVAVALMNKWKKL